MCPHRLSAHDWLMQDIVRQRRWTGAASGQLRDPLQQLRRELLRRWRQRPVTAAGAGRGQRIAERTETLFQPRGSCWRLVRGPSGAPRGWCEGDAAQGRRRSAWGGSCCCALPDLCGAARPGGSPAAPLSVCLRLPGGRHELQRRPKSLAVRSRPVAQRSVAGSGVPGVPPGELENVQADRGEQRRWSRSDRQREAGYRGRGPLRSLPCGS